MFAGHYDNAIDEVHRSIRLSPFDPLRYIPEIGLAFAYFLTERYSLAAAAAMRAVQSSPRFNLTHLLLAASYVRVGRLPEAPLEVQLALELQPNFGLSMFRITGIDPFRAEPIIAALREVGLSEH